MGKSVQENLNYPRWITDVHSTAFQVKDLHAIKKGLKSQLAAALFRAVVMGLHVFSEVTCNFAE